jgi:hypothetical protein
MLNRNVSLLVGFLLVALSPALAADEQAVTITVTGGKVDLVQVPVMAPVALERDYKPWEVMVRAADGKAIPAQVLHPGLLKPSPRTSGKVGAELHLLLPELKAGQEVKLSARFTSQVPTPARGFAWHEQGQEYSELRLADRPVVRYVHAPLDESTKEKREMTYKVFHHVFDPAGKRLVTKGPPGGLYPHHRGIYFGYNKISYGTGKTADTWHCTGDAYQSHEKFVAVEAGPQVARHRLDVAWHGKEKEVFAREERELTVYNFAGGTMIDFASRLRTTGGPVKLDGDPQHAGVQFRADNEVAASTSKQTIYVRPDGVGKPGEEWNWPAQKSQVNLPWKAMSFVLGGQRYTVANLDRPENPKEARFSERAYGRFGSYFPYELTAEKPLEVRYRFWLQEGEMTPEQVAARSAAFREQIRVVVK